MSAFIFPDMDREELELEYVAMVAALGRAAEEKVGPDRDAMQRQVLVWRSESAESAVRMAVLQQTRSLRDFEGIKQ